MDRFLIEKPDLAGVDGGQFWKLSVTDNRRLEIQMVAERANSPEYVYWDRFKYWPMPTGVRPEEMWSLVKSQRTISGGKRTMIYTESERRFSWHMVPGWEEVLHQLDMDLGGNLDVSARTAGLNPHHFISRGIMEEAIASSQLEGAVTTRRDAKRMIEEGRKPRNKSERMILNNHRAERLVFETFAKKELGLDDMLALHEVLTAGTVPTEDVGRLRRDSDNVLVVDEGTGIIYHVPPSAATMREQFERLVMYANDTHGPAEFIHPVIKAIILHFWIGYLHPFTDGNGRLARLLFRWYMLRKGYWGITFLPLSRVIRNSPAQYRDAYVYSEQDDEDLNYFIDYNLRKITQARQEFDAYLERKRTENVQMRQVAITRYGLNDRQIQLLRYLHKNSQEFTRVTTHTAIYQVSRLTAQKDLRALEMLGFLASLKHGREIRYVPTPKIAELFQ